MLALSLHTLFIFLIFLIKRISANELTFELPDNAKECFHENLKIGSTFTLEFQVIKGGNYDVDVELKSPTGKFLYKETKRQFDAIERTVEENGVYQFCFSNEFSTFTHKVIYIDWKVDGDPEHEIAGTDPRVAQNALTIIETKVGKIHKSLETCIDYQTHHRLREATGRARAEDLRQTVQNWSFGQFLLIICVTISTVLILRSFFSERQTSSNISWKRTTI